MLQAGLTIIIGVIIVQVVSKYVEKIKGTKKFKQLIKNNPYNAAITWYLSYFVKLAMYIIVSLIAIGFLGFAQPVLWLVAVIMTLSIIGVLIYSLRDLIPSAFAGAYLLNSRVIKKGDRLSIRSFKGKVKEVSLLTTTLEGEKGGIIIVPNKIITEKVLKISKKKL